VFEDIHFEHRSYDPWSAYGQSKTANILMAVEGAKRWADDGILVNAIHPGAIFETGLLRHVEMTPEMKERVANTEWKTIEQGAATAILLAASPLIDGISGRYFEDNNEAVVSETRGKGVAPYALDETAAARLWGRSLQMLRS
jgi:NAD(P)-dependent dehydrogenase (short-subunit alcohol dehydrogenase family)